MTTDMNGHVEEEYPPHSEVRGRSPSPLAEIKRGRSGSRSPVADVMRHRSQSRSISRDRAPPKARSYRSRSRSRSRSPPRRMAGGPPPPRGRRDDRVRENPTPTNVLGVFGLSLHTHDEDLEKLFSQYGRIESCKIIYDHWTRKSRGFGFITFSDQAGATAARDELNGTYLHDRPMRVDYSLTKRAHSPTPGRYMGQDVDRQRSDRDRGGYRRDEYRGGRDRDRDYDRRRREPSYSPPRRRRSPSPPRRRRSPSYDSPR